MKRVLWVMFFAVSLFSCTSADDESVDRRSEIKIHFDKLTFSKEYTFWKSLNINNYTYTLEGFNLAEGPYEYTVIVVNNEVTNGDYYTINELFDKVELDYNNTVQNYLTEDFYNNVSDVYFTIEYDKEYHYPISIRKDYSFRTTPPPGIGGYEFEIKNFLSNDL